MKQNRLIALLLAGLLLLVPCGCGLFGGKDDPKPSGSSSGESSEEDQPDPEFPVEAGGTLLLARPGNVVSLAPSLTEKLSDLGLQSRLSGVSDYCDYPESIRGLPACGTAQLPDLNEIMRLKPHLILTEGALPDEVTEALEEAEIPVAVLPRAESVEELLSRYTDLARLMEGDRSGQMIAEAFTREFQSRLDGITNRIPTGEPKIALYLRLLDFTVATGDTLEHELMGRIGLDNVAQEFTGWSYPGEAAQSADGTAAFASVDIIFMDEEFVTIKDLEQSSFYRGLPATIHDRFFYIRSIEMERQSLRTLSLLEEMAAAVWPDSGLGAPDALDEDGEADPDSDGDSPSE